MGTKKFDDIIRGKLNHLEAPYRPEHWNAFSRELDKIHTPAAGVNPHDEWIDRQISQKITRVRVPGSPSSSWPLLEKRLQEQAQIRQRLLIYKTLEVSLLLLLLISLWQWQPVWNQTHFPIELLHGKRRHAEPPATQPAPNRSAPVASNEAAFPQASADYSTEPTLTPQAAEFSSAAGYWARSKQRDPALQAPVDKLPQTNIPNALASIEVPEGSLKALDEQAQAEPGIIREGIFSMPVIASPLFLPEALMEGENEDSGIEYRTPPKRAFLNIAMLGGADYNRVMTPPNYEFRIRGFDQYTLGYGGGILLGMEYGRLEIGSGFVYSAKQYTPLPVIFIKGNAQKGFVGEKLQRVQLNLVNLPVYVRYDAIKKDKWRAYVTGGASLQIAMEANYFISPPITLPPPATQTPVIESEIRSLTNSGLLEGGPFKENSYVTANLGFGVEHFVSERWSIFTQPTYHQSIGYFSNGLGPNRDRIHTLSLWTGIRVRLLD
ncbi:MAG: hypothetical protein IPI11_12235 [Haliscomenobacter sp.]|nr:hypothetical protein [Haliscomenobacter sp.]